MKTQYFIQKIRENPFVVSNSKVGENHETTESKRRLYRNAELIAKYYKYVDILPSKNSKIQHNLGSLANEQSLPVHKKNYKFEPKDFG